MVDLPGERLSDAVPFTYIAMDIFGSFVIKKIERS